MNRRLMLAVGLCVVVTLTGCAAMRIEPAISKQIRSVAVVSLVSEKISFTKTGLTVFNNEVGQIDMGGSITTLMENVATKRLASAQPAWQIKPVAYDKEKIVSEIKLKASFTESGTAATAKGVAELARRSGVDALLVFIEGETDYATRGVGVKLSTVTMSSIMRAVITTNLFFVVVDSQGRLIAESTLDPGFRMDDIPNPTAYGFQYKLEENYRPELMGRLQADVLRSVSQATDRMMDQVGL